MIKLIDGESAIEGTKEDLMNELTYLTKQVVDELNMVDKLTLLYLLTQTINESVGIRIEEKRNE